MRIKHTKIWSAQWPWNKFFSGWFGAFRHTLVGNIWLQWVAASENWLHTNPGTSYLTGLQIEGVSEFALVGRRFAATLGKALRWVPEQCLMIGLSGMPIWYVSELVAHTNKYSGFGMNTQDVFYILTQVFHSMWTVCIPKCNWRACSAQSDMTTHNTQHKRSIKNSPVWLKGVQSWLKSTSGERVPVNSKFAVDEWFVALGWHKCHGWSMPYYAWHKVSWELEIAAMGWVNFQYSGSHQIHFQRRLYQAISASKYLNICCCQINQWARKIAKHVLINCLYLIIDINDEQECQWYHTLTNTDLRKNNSYIKTLIHIKITERNNLFTLQSVSYKWPFLIDCFSWEG